MLNWNADRVKSLTPGEIWLFIVGRVLFALGLGIVGMKYSPQVFKFLDIPAILLGLVCLILALKGFKRSNNKGNC